MIRHLNIRVSGLVQGVFYRHSAKLKTGELGITGFVRNEPDGSVYIEAQGEEKVLKEFLDWCYEGPDSARVEKVEYEFNDKIENFTNFTIE